MNSAELCGQVWGEAARSTAESDRNAGANLT